jgi:hypothetical protein
MTTSTTTTNTAAGTSTSTSKGTRLAPLLDQKLADAKQPLFEVLGWYNKAYTTARSLENDLSANENAALCLGIEFNSEAEIGTRPCGRTHTGPNVCRCYETLKAARIALTAHAPVQEETPEPTREEAPQGLTREEVVKGIDGVEQELADRAREVLRSRGAKVIPQRIGLWTAMLFLAPLGTRVDKLRRRLGVGPGISTAVAAPPKPAASSVYRVLEAAQ